MRDDGFLEAGERIHGYVVERLAAVGGEAVVYEARDPVLGRTVALKILREDVGENRPGWRRLEGEAWRTVRLEHPAFVTVYGIFPHRTGSVLVMEWVDGWTLAERMARGPLGSGEIRELFLQVARALAVAHRARMVHGDLSPANVMVRGDGRVKVLDPAIPTAAGDRSPVTGTPPYAAPELIAGHRPTPASDVYSFGAMLEEILAVPNGGGDEGTGLLRRLARQCLQADPGLRPADGSALAEVLDGRRGTGRPERTSVRRLGSVVLASVLLALAFFAGHWAGRRGVPRPGVWRGMERLQVDGSLPVLLADGSGVVYRTSDDLGIALLPMESGRPRRIWHGTAPVLDLAAFPNGRSVLFAAGTREPWLWEVAIDGGLPRRIAPGRCPAISPDGERILAIQTLEGGVRRIVILDRGGGSVRCLRTFRSSMIPVSVAFGPRGESAFAVATDGVHLSRLLEISLADGNTLTYAEIAGVAVPGIAVPGGTGGILWPVRTEARGDANLVLTRPGESLARVVYPGPGRASHPSLDRSGTLLAFQLTELDRELVELAVEPGMGAPVAATEILPGSRGASQPRVGPDPNFLLFQSPQGTVQLMNRRTGRSRPLFATGKSQFNPTWSPDGKLAACARLAGGHSDLWVVPAEGGSAERLTGGPANDFQPVWHPDGRHILFISDREGVEDLYVLELPEARIVRLGKDGAANPAVSSDGRLVVFVVGAQGTSPKLRLARLEQDVSSLRTVWERPVTVNRWAGAKARFSPDGRWLAFDQPRSGGGADIRVIPVEGGGTARDLPLTDFPFAASLAGWFDWGPDWKIIATVARRTDRICILHDAGWWFEHAR